MPPTIHPQRSEAAHSAPLNFFLFLTPEHNERKTRSRAPLYRNFLPHGSRQENSSAARDALQNANCTRPTGMKILFLITFWLRTPVVVKNLITFQIYMKLRWDNGFIKTSTTAEMSFSLNCWWSDEFWRKQGTISMVYVLAEVLRADQLPDWRDSVPFMVKAATFYAFAQPHPSSRPNKWWPRWVIYFDWPLNARSRPLGRFSSFASDWNNCLRWMLRAFLWTH